jgi:hypothetical protein
MKKISLWFYKISNWKVTLFALLIFLVFSGLTLPVESRKAEMYSQGAGSADTKLFYNAAELTKMAEAYGEDGRNAYLKARWTFDLAFPLVYTFFLVTATSYFLGKTFLEGSNFRLLNLIPLIAMIFDFLENTAVSLVMWRYPVPCPPGLLLAPVFTPIKWLLVVLSFFILLFALIASGWRKIRQAK